MRIDHDPPSLHWLVRRDTAVMIDPIEPSRYHHAGMFLQAALPRSCVRADRLTGRELIVCRCSNIVRNTRRWHGFCQYQGECLRECRLQFVHSCDPMKQLPSSSVMQAHLVSDICAFETSRPLLNCVQAIWFAAAAETTWQQLGLNDTFGRMPHEVHAPGMTAC